MKKHSFLYIIYSLLLSIILLFSFILSLGISKNNSEKSNEYFYSISNQKDDGSFDFELDSNEEINNIQFHVYDDHSNDLSSSFIFTCNNEIIDSIDYSIKPNDDFTINYQSSYFLQVNVDNKKIDIPLFFNYDKLYDVSIGEANGFNDYVSVDVSSKDNQNCSINTIFLYTSDNQYIPPYMYDIDNFIYNGNSCHFDICLNELYGYFDSDQLIEICVGYNSINLGSGSWNIKSTLPSIDFHVVQNDLYYKRSSIIIDDYNSGTADIPLEDINFILKDKNNLPIPKNSYEIINEDETFFIDFSTEYLINIDKDQTFILEAWFNGEMLNNYQFNFLANYDLFHVKNIRKTSKCHYCIEILSDKQNNDFSIKLFSNEKEIPNSLYSYSIINNCIQLEISFYDNFQIVFLKNNVILDSYQIYQKSSNVTASIDSTDDVYGYDDGDIVLTNFNSLDENIKPENITFKFFENEKEKTKQFSYQTISPMKWKFSYNKDYSFSSIKKIIIKAFINENGQEFEIAETEFNLHPIACNECNTTMIYASDVNGYNSSSIVVSNFFAGTEYTIDQIKLEFYINGFNETNNFIISSFSDIDAEKGSANLFFSLDQNYFFDKPLTVNVKIISSLDKNALFGTTSFVIYPHQISLSFEQENITINGREQFSVGVENIDFGTTSCTFDDLHIIVKRDENGWLNGCDWFNIEFTKNALIGKLKDSEVTYTDQQIYFEVYCYGIEGQIGQFSATLKAEKPSVSIKVISDSFVLDDEIKLSFSNISLGTFFSNTNFYNNFFIKIEIIDSEGNVLKDLNEKNKDFNVEIIDNNNVNIEFKKSVINFVGNDIYTFSFQVWYQIKDNYNQIYSDEFGEASALLSNLSYIEDKTILELKPNMTINDCFSEFDSSNGEPYSVNVAKQFMSKYIFDKEDQFDQVITNDLYDQLVSPEQNVDFSIKNRPKNMLLDDVSFELIIKTGILKNTNSIDLSGSNFIKYNINEITINDQLGFNSLIAQYCNISSINFVESNHSIDLIDVSYNQINSIDLSNFNSQITNLNLSHNLVNIEDINLGKLVSNGKVSNLLMGLDISFVEGNISSILISINDQIKSTDSNIFNSISVAGCDLTNFNIFDNSVLINELISFDCHDSNFAIDNFINSPNGQDSFGNAYFKKIENLNAENCNLTDEHSDWSFQISEKSPLKSLNLSGTNIKQIVINDVSIESLDLSNSEFEKMYFLNYFVWCNIATDLPHNYPNGGSNIDVYYGVDISISRNQTFVDRGVRGVGSKSVHLAYNDLSGGSEKYYDVNTYEHMIWSYTSLKYLDISGTSICPTDIEINYEYMLTESKRDFYDWDTLKYEDNCVYFSNLIYINIKNNEKYSGINEEKKEWTDELEFLTFFPNVSTIIADNNNNLKTLDFISGLSNLSSLSITNSSINNEILGKDKVNNNIVVDWASLISLKTLDLSENNITTFNFNINICPLLEILDLSSNWIGGHGDDHNGDGHMYANFKNLQEIDVSNNEYLTILDVSKCLNIKVINCNDCYYLGSNYNVDLAIGGIYINDQVEECEIYIYGCPDMKDTKKMIKVMTIHYDDINNLADYGDTPVSVSLDWFENNCIF